MQRAPWQPSGLVTWTTDFGLADPYVGIMKGVVATRCPAARHVDLTHQVPPQDVRTAAFQLRHAWRWFPPGTVHVAVVDPGVGSERRILVAEDGGHAFLAPDNGLLGPALSDAARVFALDAPRYALPGASATFHGRDVFAPAAAALLAGLAPEETGAPAGEWSALCWPAPVAAEGAWRGEVLLVDHFGNLVTNVVPAELELALADWRLEAAGREVPIVRTYADVAAGAALALVDSYGHLELAVRGGHAADALGLGSGAAVTLRRRT